jgi:molybdenum cofactor cytidylyltransferase
LTGIVLAAGASSRMGSLKALLKVSLSGPPETFVDRLIRLLAAHCSPVVVVLGAQAETIRAGIVRQSQAVLVMNERHSQGQLSSLQCGLRAVPQNAAGVLFTPVDFPTVRAETIAGLVSAFHEEPEALLVIPRHLGKHGHPVCCARELVPEFLALPPEAQAREIIHRHMARARFVDVDDAGVLRDVDDPEAYSKLSEPAGLP